MRAGIEPERRVLAGHERPVGDDAEHPAVEAEHEIEDLLRVPVLEQQQDAGDKHEDADQSERPSGPGEDSRDTKMRDAEQPPPDQREAAAQVLRVVDLESRRVLGHISERERRVLVGSEGSEV